ncbi:ADP binding protein [Aureococcus anophagefferens]|uniref:ADP binding protein n=1 Tax=Aureococcus anophagefferens TaxID=44056 RepID=A0ABR1FLF6_AURAN
MGAGASTRQPQPWRIAGLGPKLGKAGASRLAKGYGGEDMLDARDAEEYLALVAGCGAWSALARLAPSREAAVEIGALDAALADAAGPSVGEVVAYVRAYDRRSCAACRAFALKSAALPAAPGGLVRRAAAADAVVSGLLSETARLAAVAGRGGNGKSVLAASCVADLAGHFVDGVAWVAVGQSAAPAAVLRSVAAKLLGPYRAAALGTAAALRAAVKRYCASRACLVCLDDCWAPELAASALKLLGPRSRLLVTCRSAKDGAKDALGPLATDAAAAVVELDKMDAGEGLALLRSVAGAVVAAPRRARRRGARASPLCLSMVGAALASGAEAGAVADALEAAGDGGYGFADASVAAAVAALPGAAGERLLEDAPVDVVVADAEALLEGGALEGDAAASHGLVVGVLRAAPRALRVGGAGEAGFQLRARCPEVYGRAGASVLALASPGGALLARGGAPGSHAGASPWGPGVASCGCSDGRLRVFDAKGAELWSTLVATLDPLRKAVLCVCVDRRGAWLAAGSAGGGVALYAVADEGAPSWTALGDDGGKSPSVTALAAAVLPGTGGGVVLAGKDDGSVSLLLENGTVMDDYADGHGKAVSALGADDGYFVSCCAREGEAAVWENGDESCRFGKKGTNAFEDVACVPGARRFAVACSRSKQVLVYALDGSGSTHELALPGAACVCVAGREDSILVGAGGDLLRLWASGRATSGAWTGSGGEWKGDNRRAVKALAAWGDVVVAINGKGALDVYAADALATKTGLANVGHEGPVVAVAAVAGGFLTASAYPDNALILWSPDGEKVKSYETRGEIKCLDAWEEGDFFATAALNCTARVVATASDGRGAVVLDHPAPVLAVACLDHVRAPNTIHELRLRAIVTSAGDKKLRSFAAATDGAWEPRREIPNAEAVSLRRVAGDVVFAGGKYPETRLTVWRVGDLADPPAAAPPKPLARLPAHASDATTLAAVDEDTVLSCSCDDTLLVWRRDSGADFAADGEPASLPAVAPPLVAAFDDDDASKDFRDMLEARAEHVALCVWDESHAIAGSAACPCSLVVIHLRTRTRRGTLTFDAPVLCASAANGVLCVGDRDGNVHFAKNLHMLSIGNATTTS